jgi:hypothetical protein
LLYKTRGLNLERREGLLTRDRLEVVLVPIILHLKVHLLVVVPGNKLNRPNMLLLKQALQLDLLLLIHPQTGHASSVDMMNTANYCPNRAAYTTTAPMKQGQASAGKSQPLYVNQG